MTVNGSNLAQMQIPSEYMQLYSTLKSAIDYYSTNFLSRNDSLYSVVFGAELLPANANRGTDLPTATSAVKLNEHSQKSVAHHPLSDEQSKRCRTPGPPSRLASLTDEQTSNRGSSQQSPRWIGFARLNRADASRRRGLRRGNRRRRERPHVAKKILDVPK